MKGEQLASRVLTLKGGCFSKSKIASSVYFFIKLSDSFVSYQENCRVFIPLSLVVNRLLNTVAQALQNAGLDLSQASISVQIDLGKRANRAPSSGTSISKVQLTL